LSILFSVIIRFAVKSGSLPDQVPLKTTPLKHNVTATEPLSIVPPCDVITPECLQGLYFLPNAPAIQPSNIIAVTGYGSNWAQQADLTVRYVNLVPVGHF
jgi:tripeptidyl-peptidase-1